MAEFLSPGVFIEEVNSGGQTIDSVGTSTMAVVGFTTMGPVQEATLVTDPSSYARQFGDFTRQSRVPNTVQSFFTNGGTRVYVVRVVPSDAATAENCIGSAGTLSLGTGTGVSPDTTTGTATSLPVQAGSAVISWKLAIAGEAPTLTPLASGSANLGPFNFTTAHGNLTTDTITLHWLETTVAKTATLSSTGTIGGASAANISTWTVNRTTGQFAFKFASTHGPDAGSVTVDYNYNRTVTDNGAGVFVGTGVAGTINYATGAVSITFTGATNIPMSASPISMAYSQCLWLMEAANPGAWGNGVQVTLTGNANSFTAGAPTVTGAGSYSKFDVSVALFNTQSQTYQTVETFEELVFDDNTDPMYAPEVINDGSSYLVVTDEGTLKVPTDMAGVTRTGVSVGSGDGTTTTFSATLANAPMVKTSILVHYTIAGTTGVVTADANGNLKDSGGNLNTSKTNTINYTTGVLTMNFATAPDNGTTVTADYISSPVASSHSYVLIGGSDGTIANITEAQISNAGLQASKEGMYALDRVDEMMQLVIPDFAGDATVAQDEIAYAEQRRDLFVILTTPSGYSAEQAVDWTQITMAQKSKYAAVYWPWVNIPDILNNGRPTLFPALGQIAGIYARTDSSKNVGKAPGGTVDGALRGISSLEHNPDKGERDTVYPARVNPLINTPQTGMAVWGVRTLSADPAWKYINATRLFIFVEKSTFNSTHFIVFESINDGLYSRVKSMLDSFLNNLFINGYFAGNTPSQAYFIICDSTNNPPDVVNSGQVVIDVGLAPNRPAEFVRFRFQQKALS